MMSNYFYNVFASSATFNTQSSSATFGDMQYDCYNGDILMYDGNNWFIPSKYNNSSKIISKRKIHLSHCRNCGAPINPNSSKCDYCGSYYIEEG